jgi:hypothetical protein
MEEATGLADERRVGRIADDILIGAASIAAEIGVRPRRLSVETNRQVADPQARQEPDRQPQRAPPRRKSSHILEHVCLRRKHIQRF